MTKWEINRYNSPTTYFPSHIDGDFVFGFIARQKLEVHYDGPETGFSPKNVEFWEKSAVVLNLEEDQQVIGVEFNQNVGRPKGLLNELVFLMNVAAGPNEFKIDSFPLHRRDTFYRAIQQAKVPITTIEFTYVVPNVFGGSGEVKDALDNYKRGVHARTVKIVFNNPDGLNPYDETVVQGVDYVAKGGGEVKAKTNGVEVFNSERKDKVTLSLDAESKDAIETKGSLPAKIRTMLRR